MDIRSQGGPESVLYGRIRGLVAPLAFYCPDVTDPPYPRFRPRADPAAAHGPGEHVGAHRNDPRRPPMDIVQPLIIGDPGALSQSVVAGRVEAAIQDLAMHPCVPQPQVIDDP